MPRLGRRRREELAVAVMAIASRMAEDAFESLDSLLGNHTCRPLLLGPDNDMAGRALGEDDDDQTWGRRSLVWLFPTIYDICKLSPRTSPRWWASSMLKRLSESRDAVRQCCNDLVVNNMQIRRQVDRWRRAADDMRERFEHASHALDDVVQQRDNAIRRLESAEADLRVTRSQAETTWRFYDEVLDADDGVACGGIAGDKDLTTQFERIQPEGPSFRVDRYAVEWQKWSFRIGFTPKEGLVLHTVAYDDGDRGRRSIAHRLSFVEMVVPYGDPNGCDCLGFIKYFDAHFTNYVGGVETIENCVCLHEEDFGVLWKHQDWRTGWSEVRRSRRLSASFFCTLANYEYGFFWHFYQDGHIEAQVKLTGILSVGSLRDGESRPHGTVIAPGLYAPVHQHFFVARLDMAVDSKPGEGHNQVVEVNVRSDEPGPANPHENAFRAEETILRTEMQAKRDCNLLTGRHWIIRNTRTVNRTGRPTGYRLQPGSNCLPLALPGAKFLRRAAFLKHNLWVTQYRHHELFPGGDFPNQNPRIGEGLPTWVARNARIDNHNVVLWYVFGIIHVPRLEDWPVMPVEMIGFSLMPHGFFDCSPAIDVPPSQPAESTTPPSPSSVELHGKSDVIAAIRSKL
ncbi:hypothetical protein CBR_g48049 [Chara braunii]|uniref:Amine oxidase n=1 Tax=Chara braunii TaxID=69332 RepID=A0A388M1X9_CHABU|nr:hypothetical protein CBR_g48049 [Chara braunii]|eukprot:GBG88580.1 hypothetical protein CBR_g48049 [Chara braunii]